MSAKPNAAVISDRQRQRAPHPLEAQFAAAGLDRFMVDDFPTPPWGARAWCEHVETPARLADCSVWEPTVNRGFLELGLRPYFRRMFCSDIFNYGLDFPIYNFLDLSTGLLAMPTFVVERPDWIIFNPPFVRAEEFILCAERLANVGIAALCRTQITETVGRFERIFERFAGRWAFSQFVERLPMAEGSMSIDQDTMSAYGWLTIWKEPQPAWFVLARRHIPPCRSRLERAGDYDWRTPWHPPVNVKKPK